VGVDAFETLCLDEHPVPALSSRSAPRIGAAPVGKSASKKSTIRNYEFQFTRFRKDFSDRETGTLAQEETLSGKRKRVFG